MRILAFEEEPTLFGGGQERSLYEVLSQLKKRGFQLSLCYARHGELLAEYFRICDTIVHLPTRIFSIKRAPHMAADLCRLWLRAIGGSKWDVVYTNQYFDLPMAATLGQMLRVPVICHLRLAAPSYLSRQFRWGLARSACLIANSHYTMASYEAQGFPASRFRVIYNGIDTSYFAPQPPLRQTSEPRKRRVVFLGRVTPDKGMEVLVDAFAQVRRKREDIELRIVGQARGDGTVPLDYVEQFREQCRQKGIIGLEFRPHVADVRSELGRADLLVLPSISPESFGRVLIEAMASGIPVVASRVGGIPEVLAPDFEEMLVEPNDSTALASAVMRLLDWRTERPELGLLCRQYVVERFGQARMIDELVATFEDVVSSRQH